VRALRVPEPGAVPEPADLPEPDPAPGRALVRVRAASLNPVDVAIAAGRFYMDVPDPPYVPGAEAAGEVIHSAAHPVGAPVWCLPMTGALAEVVSVPESAVVPLPGGIDYPRAAGLGIAGLAGWMPVRERGGLAAGETVLVLGAGGAVGQVAIQAARDGDAERIVAAARSAGGRERALAAGADVALPTDAGLGEALREACGEGADLVIDILWGEPAVAAIGALRRGGRIVQVGSAAGQVAEVPAGPFRGMRLDLRGFSVFSEDPGDLAAAYPDLADAAVRGAVSMSVVEVPFAEAAGAWSRVASSGAGGDKLVVIP
jgi:NADPH:quinone reductase-like Zn-dependent oxidoreductase